MKNTSRRQFLKKSSIGMAGGLMASGYGHGALIHNVRQKLSREVWIGTLSQDRLEVRNKEEMTDTVIGFLEGMKVYQPDIICLPEAFTYHGPAAGTSTYGENAETMPFLSLRPFRQYAKENRCYLICPIIIGEDARAYNAAVVIDRQGEILGNYKKMHPTIVEMDEGIHPGPLDPPVFDLDFGRIGIQICFDIQWMDGWESLKRKNPDIIFWPSAFSGRTLIQTKAWECAAFTVSSTNKGPARICDLSGRTIAQTEFWNRNWICAPVNLERILIHTWPYVKHFPSIKEKYGRQVMIETHDEEEWTIMESLSPDIKLRDVLDEFGILDMKEHVEKADRVQQKYRT